MHPDVNIFIGILRQATARIDPHYFQLPVAGLESPIYRERVYCYELYHQLRSVMPASFPYVLDGEVAKDGHPILRETLGPVKPDFIVHVPREMGENLAVVEVKPITANMNGIRKDLATLEAFLDHAAYQAAIYLVYGDDDRRHHTFSQAAGNRILLLWHRRPGEPCERVP